MKEVLSDIERWRARGERFAVATVIATRRSAPRPIGAKFAVSESGEMAGSVSGGCVESDADDHACQVLEGGRPQFLSYGITDESAFSVGLPCGGEIDVFVENAPDALVERLLRIIETEEPAILFTVVEGAPFGAGSSLVTEAGELVGGGAGRARSTTSASSCGEDATPCWSSTTEGGCSPRSTGRLLGCW